MKDTWTQLLRDIEPELDKLSNALKLGPTYPIQMKKCGEYWSLIINQIWPYDVNITAYSMHELYERCTWISLELAKWDDVVNAGETKWLFKNKQQAEKFITLYNLVWGS